MIKWGLSLFKFENKWLSVNGFGEKLEQWWRGNKATSKTSFRIASKLKAMKSAIKGMV